MTSAGRRDGDGSIVVRPIRRETDAAAAADALVDSAAVHAALEPERFRLLDPAAVAAMLRAGEELPRDLPADQGITLVAELDRRVVGIAVVRVIRPGPPHRPIKYGEVTDLAVTADARRRGVGAVLLEAAEDWARARGCTYAVLDVNAHNVDAARFYTGKMGYRPAGLTLLRELDGDAGRAG